MMCRRALLTVTVPLAICLLLTTIAYTKPSLPSPTPSRLYSIAWEHQGRVQLAIANPSSSYEELTAAFGYYRLGKRIIDEFSVDVPPKTILVTTYPKITDDAGSGYRQADTIYLSDASNRQVAATQIIGLHPATMHYRVERYLVSAGREALVYLETPSELDQETEVYISIGKTYTLGDHVGRLRVDSHSGTLGRAKPPFGDTENPDDYQSYSYTWRGLVVKIPTPRLEGVERLDFDIEKFISIPDGTARHGLSAPPILVYGPDMRVVEN